MDMDYYKPKPLHINSNVRIIPSNNIICIHLYHNLHPHEKSSFVVKENPNPKLEGCYSLEVDIPPISNKFTIEP